MFDNKLEIGNGIFSVRDVAQILRVPYNKVSRWISYYWNEKLAEHYKRNYWIENTKAVNFYTFIEIYVMMQLTEAGLKPSKILQAHKELTEFYKINVPFATKKILDNIKTDKHKIYLQLDNDNIISLDQTKQLNLKIIQNFYTNIDFDSDTLASRFFPLGKKCHVVCDPHHKFGQPTIYGTNIQTEVIFNLYQAKEPIPFIADIYQISEQKIKNAIHFHRQVA